MTKPHELFPSSSSSPPPRPPPLPFKLGTDQSEVMITKLKPKIRVIHVDAPKVIQTDAANFRELVQRLTGKPADNNNNKKKKIMEKEEEQDFLGLRNGKKKRIKNEEDEEEEEEVLMRRSKSNKESLMSGSFFDHHHHHHGFSELDGFMVEQLSTMN